MADLVQIGFVANADGIKSANREMNNLASSGDKADKALAGTAKTVNVLAAALAAVGLGIGASEIIQYSDAWKNVNSQLRQVTGSEKELITTRSSLVKLTKDTRGDLLSTVELYSSLTRATADLNVSQKDVAGVTKTINNLFLASGKGAKESAGAILQLSQGLAAGALRGDEFNSVAEGAPRIMDALAQKLGMARGELREFAATGGITAQILVDALKDYESEAQRLADSTEKTFGQNLVNARTNITEFVGGATMLNEVIGAIGGGIESFSEDLGVFVDSAQVAATVVGLALVPSMYKYVASLVAATAAQLTMGTASVRTVSALGVVSTQAAATTVSMNALRMASAVFLGPIGIAIAAVGAGAIAFDHFSGGASKAEETLEALRKEAAMATTEIDKLADSTKRVQELDLKENLSGLVELRDQLSQSIGEDSFFSEEYLIRTTEDIRILNAEIDKTRSQLVGISEDFKHVAASTSAMGEAMSAAGASMAEIKPSKEFEKLSYEIEKQIALHGDNSKAASLAYDIANGKVKDLADGEGDLLVARARILEQMDDRAEKEEKALDAAQKYADAVSKIQMAEFDDLERALGSENKSWEAIEKQNEEFDALIESVDEFGGAWSRTGSAVIDAVGGIANALDDYSMRMEAIGKKEAELAIARKESMGDPAKIAAISAAEVRLSKERTRANISGYSQMAGAAASMFKEQSKGREALNKAEKAFAAIEIALALQKAGANALTAITSSFAAPFPVNFAAGAAMIAIMSGLGVFGGGGGTSAPTAEELQAAQGTGTVMGGADDKSESIINALEAYEDIGIDQLSELRGIRDALTGLSSGIALLARDFISGGNFSGAEVKGLGNTQALSVGDFAGKEVYDFLNPLGADILNRGLKDLFGSTKKSLKDSGLKLDNQELGDILAGNFEAYFYNTVETTKKKLFGLSKKISTKDELTGVDSAFEDQIAGIFGYIGSVVGGSLDVLGIDSAKAIEDFVISIGKVSFKDLSGEEIQAELEAIFSQQADLIAEFMIPQITQYQKMGEGAFETLARVAKEQAVFNDALENMGLSLGSLSNIMRIDVAQSIIDMMGGLEEFSGKTSAYFEEFFSEDEKIKMLGDSLGEAFGSLGVPMQQTREGFRSVIEGLDLTADADQRLFASLMELVPGIGQYIEALDKSAAAQENAAKKEIEAQEAAQEAARKSEEAAAKAVRKAEEAAQQAAAEAQKKIDAQRQSMELTLMDELGLEHEALAIRRALELASMDESLRGLQQQINAQQDLNKAMEEAEAVASAAAEAMRAADDEIYGSMINSLNSQKALIDENLSGAEEALRKSFDAEKLRIGAVDQEKIAMIDSAAAAEIESINSAHAAKMAALGESNAAEIASIEQRKSIASKMASDLRGLSDKLSSAAAAIGITVMSSAQAQDQLSVALRDARNGNFGAALNLDGAIGSLSGMNESGYSNAVDFAVAQGRAQYALTELAKLSGTRATTEEQLVILLESESVAAQARHEASIAAAGANNQYLASVVQNNADSQKQGVDLQVEALDKQLNELLGIDTTVLSLSDAISQYEEARKEADNFDYDAQVAILDNAHSQLGELQRMNEQMKIANENMQAQLKSIAKHTSETASIARRGEFTTEATA